MTSEAVNEQSLWNALSKVVDPELQIDIVSLGLVYALKAEGAVAVVDMTMTSPGCPLAGEIIMNAQNELLKVEGVEKADIRLVWSPAWKPEMMNDDAKAILGIF